MIYPNDVIRLIALRRQLSAPVLERINRIYSDDPRSLYLENDTQNEIRGILRDINSFALVNRRFARAICFNAQITRHRRELLTLCRAIREASLEYRRFECANERDERGDDED